MIFGFLFPLHPALSVFIFSIIVLVIMNVFYRILINQNEAKAIKDGVKAKQEEYRKEQKAGNTERANKLMSEALKEQGKLMRLSLKPMIISLIIVAILLPGLATVYGDAAATDKFNYAGKELVVGVNGNSVGIAGESCEAPCTLRTGSGTFNVAVSDGKAYIAPVVAQLPVALPLLGNDAGWLAWYIIVSLPFALLVRKIMKINI